MIRGIDNQVLMNRVTEYTKDMSTQLRKDAVAHDFTAALTLTTSELAQKKVQTLEKKGNPSITDDKQRKSGGKQEKQEFSDSDEPEEEEYLAEGGLIEPFAKRRIVRSKIDIKV